MKFFVALLASFFLILSVLPCADEVPSVGESVWQVANDHDHPEESDNCAPFCYCHCCHVHATFTPGTQESLLFDDKDSAKTYYVLAKPESWVHSLLRPPIV
jgi:hypothetical protein